SMPAASTTPPGHAAGFVHAAQRDSADAEHVDVPSKERRRFCMRSIISATSSVGAPNSWDRSAPEQDRYASRRGARAEHLLIPNPPNTRRRREVNAPNGFG